MAKGFVHPLKKKVVTKLFGDQVESGFSIAGVLVGTAILSIVFAGMLAMIDNSTKYSKFLSQNLSMNNHIELVNKLLNDRASCTVSLDGTLNNKLVSGSPSPVKGVPISLYYADVTGPNPVRGQKLIAPGDPVKDGSMPTGMTLVELSIPEDPILTSAGEYLAKLRFKVQRDNGTNEAYGGAIIRDVPIVLVVNGANRFKECYGGGSGDITPKLCTETGGYYQAGPPAKCIFPQVLISDYTTTPHLAAFAASTALFQIKNKSANVGSVGLGEDHGEFWSDGGNDGAFNITNTSAHPNANIRFVATAAGNSPPLPADPENLLMKLYSDNTVVVGNYTGGAPRPVPAGEVYFNSNVTVNGTVVQTSDRRLKQDIKTLENSLEKIGQMRGVSFRWIEEVARRGEVAANNFGLIAQEVEAVYPELVHEAANTKRVNYIGLIPVLLEAVKTQQEQIVHLEKKIKKLEAQGEFFRAKNEN